MKKLDWELKGYEINGNVPPHRFTQIFDLLFINEAAIWAVSRFEFRTQLLTKHAD